MLSSARRGEVSDNADGLPQLRRDEDIVALPSQPGSGVQSANRDLVNSFHEPFHGTDSRLGRTTPIPDPSAP
jgi:hypothetical protein